MWEYCHNLLARGGGSVSHFNAQEAAEGEVLDSDGIAIHFLLFERERLLCELQIYKDDGSPIKRSVDVEDVEPMTLR